MKKFRSIAFRYIKVQKKRSISVLLGIIISTTLFMTVSTLLTSLYNTEINNSVKRYGNFEVSFKNINQDTLKGIKDDKQLSNISIVKHTEMEAQINSAKFPIIQYYYDEKALSDLVLNIKEGNLPKEDQDIMIEDSFMNYLDNPKVGEKITLYFTKIDSDEMVKKEYKLCGILRSQVYGGTDAGFTFISKLNSNKDDSDGLFDIYFDIGKQAKVYESISSLSENYQISQENIAYNNSLLSLRNKTNNGVSKNSIISIVLILFSVVTISTILVIYNIFNISILERIKDYGILRAIGATPKQIRKLVLLEGFTLSIIGIPIGLMAGLIMTLALTSIITTLNIDDYKSISIAINPLIVLLNILLGIITTLLSVLVPSFKASRISPLRAINNKTIDAAIPTKINYLFVRRFLGIEGELAVKYIQRNKKRFFLTTSSLIISMILFISFSVLTVYVDDIHPRSENSFFDYKVIKNDNFTEPDLKLIENQPNVDKIYKIQNGTNPIVLTEDKLNNEYYKHFPVKSKPIVKDNKIYYGGIATELIAYNENLIEECNKYLINGDINTEKLNHDAEVIVYVHNKVYDHTEAKYYDEKIANLSTGDEIIIDTPTYDIVQGKADLSQGYKVKVQAVLNDIPLIGFVNEPSPVTLIMSENLFKDITKIQNVDSVGIIVKKGADKDVVLAFLKDLVRKDSNIQIIDYGQQKKDKIEENLIKKAFLFSFVVTILIIGILNIFNIISTNIILRKSEFAMLKSIGMNQKRISKIIYIEGLIYWVFSTLSGIILGLPLSKFLYNHFNNIKQITYRVPILEITISALLILFTIILTVAIPTRKLKNINIIESLRNEE